MTVDKNNIPNISSKDLDETKSKADEPKTKEAPKGKVERFTVRPGYIVNVGTPDGTKKCKEGTVLEMTRKEAKCFGDALSLNLDDEDDDKPSG